MKTMYKLAMLPGVGSHIIGMVRGRVVKITSDKKNEVFFLHQDDLSKMFVNKFRLIGEEEHEGEEEYVLLPSENGKTVSVKNVVMDEKPKSKEKDLKGKLVKNSKVTNGYELYKKDGKYFVYKGDKVVAEFDSLKSALRSFKK